MWTEEEILLLLESVLKHGDDWELIAQSVSTKSRLDCISKLIELPFGEFLMGSASGRLSSSIPTEDENGGHHSPSHPAEQMKTDGQEHEQTDTGEEKEDRVDEDEPPAKRKHVELTSDGDSSLMKQVNVWLNNVPLVFSIFDMSVVFCFVSASSGKEFLRDNIFTYCATGRRDGKQSWSISHNRCYKSCNCSSL